MPPKKQVEWVSVKEAAKIVGSNSNREDISTAYIRVLAKHHKIRVREVDGRTNEYLRADCETIVVKRKGVKVQA